MESTPESKLDNPGKKKIAASYRCNKQTREGLAENLKSLWRSTGYAS
jgi:hypothetical protein